MVTNGELMAALRDGLAPLVRGIDVAAGTELGVRTGRSGVGVPYSRSCVKLRPAGCEVPTVSVYLNDDGTAFYINVGYTLLAVSITDHDFLEKIARYSSRELWRIVDDV